MLRDLGDYRKKERKSQGVTDWDFVSQRSSAMWWYHGFLSTPTGSVFPINAELCCHWRVNSRIFLQGREQVLIHSQNKAGRQNTMQNTNFQALPNPSRVPAPVMEWQGVNTRQLPKKHFVCAKRHIYLICLNSSTEKAIQKKKKNASFNHTWAWGHKTEKTCEQDPSIFHKSLEVRKSCSSLPSFLHEHPANPIYTCFRRFYFYVGICLGKKKNSALSIVALQITM